MVPLYALAARSGTIILVCLWQGRDLLSSRAVARAALSGTSFRTGCAIGEHHVEMF
jgi:hypothetical protein